MSVVHSFFGFGGRINRAKFWLLSILLVVLDRCAPGRLPHYRLDSDRRRPAGPRRARQACSAHFGLCGRVPRSVRRHDRDLGVLSGNRGEAAARSRQERVGIVVFYIVPWRLGSVVNVADKQGNDTVGLVAGLVGLVCVIWGLVELGFLRGTRGPNRFGPDPLQPELGLSAAPAASKPAA
jgi:uncharacterized membrane protein YhaH (DUF805 family)